MISRCKYLRCCRPKEYFAGLIKIPSPTGSDFASRTSIECKTLAALAEKIKPEELNNPLLKSGVVGAAASKVAVHKEVRAALYDFQRGFAAKPGVKYKGAVLDGRDIGTVICPDADVKLYVDAKSAVRAERRHKELLSYGEDISLEKVIADLTERDRRDQNRTEAPLKPAANAHLLDTTNLSIDAAFMQAKALIEIILPQT